jgi:GT2 family glycosyltransferase
MDSGGCFAEDGHSRVLILVVNWNGRDCLLECLESLAKISYPKDAHRILVIDNGSRDNSCEAVRNLFPEVGLLPNRTNLGYVRAVNQGIQVARDENFDYVWILNNDVVVDESALSHLVREAENDKTIGILGPFIYSFSERHPEPHVGYTINFWTGRLKKLRYRVDLFTDPETRIEDVDSIVGCSNLVRTSIVCRTGCFSPLYGVYFEETDFNVRAARAGFRIVVVRGARVWHREAATMNKHMLRRAYLLLRNLLLFEILNARRRELLVFIPYYFAIHIPCFFFRGLMYGCQLSWKKLREKRTPPHRWAGKAGDR